jgi:hypothetical protein
MQGCALRFSQCTYFFLTTDLVVFIVYKGNIEHKSGHDLVKPNQLSPQLVVPPGKQVKEKTHVEYASVPDHVYHSCDRRCDFCPSGGEITFQCAARE